MSKLMKYHRVSHNGNQTVCDDIKHRSPGRQDAARPVISEKEFAALRKPERCSVCNSTFGLPATEPGKRNLVTYMELAVGESIFHPIWGTLKLQCRRGHRHYFTSEGNGDVDFIDFGTKFARA